MNQNTSTLNLNDVIANEKKRELRKTVIKAKISKIIIITMLSLYVLISIYPFIWATIVSFMDPAKISKVGLIPWISDAGWSAKNYNSFFESPFTKEYASTWIANSFIYAISNATLNVFFNFLAGYALARISFKGKKFITWYILVALMVPVQATQIPQLYILIMLGIINQDTPNLFWFMGILSTGMTSGVLIFMVRQFFINQSESVEEAGFIDGLTRFKIFLKISLRTMLPLIALQWTSVFIGSWNNFILFTLWASGDPSRLTLVPALAKLSETRFGNAGMGRSLAAAVMSFGPVLLVYMISLQFQKRVMIDGEK